MTNDSGEVIALAVRLGERLWRDDFRYSTCGMLITELMPETIRQPAVWGELGGHCACTETQLAETKSEATNMRKQSFICSPFVFVHSAGLPAHLLTSL